MLENPDGTPSVSDVWKNSDGTPAQRVLFTKKIDGTYYAAVATPDSNARVLAVESAFINKNRKDIGTVLNMEQNSPQATPETPQRANILSINTTIPQNGAGVNTPNTESVSIPAAQTGATGVADSAGQSLDSTISQGARIVNDVIQMGVEKAKTKRPQDF